MAVAHRMYARALFQAAQDEGRLDEVAADLAALAGALEDVPELRAFLRNPQIDPLEKARVAGEIAAGADELVRNFLSLVAEKGRAGELVEMNAELEVLVARGDPVRRSHRWGLFLSDLESGRERMVLVGSRAALGGLSRQLS